MPVDDPFEDSDELTYLMYMYDVRSGKPDCRTYGLVRGDDIQKVIVTGWTKLQDRLIVLSTTREYM